MNQYKSPQSKKPNSVDGFLVTGPRRPVSGVNNFGTRPQTPFRTTLNDFNKNEGLNRQTANPITSSGSYKQPESTPSLNAQFEKSNLNSTNNINQRSFNINRSGLNKPKKRKNRRGSKKKLFARTFMFSVITVMLVFGAFFGKAW